MTWKDYSDHWNFSGDTSQAVLKTGGNEEYERDTQPRFMKEKGLLPKHKFIDIGCGCLRGTADLVEYLNDGNYYGADISQGLLDAGKIRLKDLGITNTPNLNRINSFYELPGNHSFDFALSVSLVTHLYPSHVCELFDSVSKILKPSGKYFFTIYSIPEEDPFYFRGDVSLSRYKKSWLVGVGKLHGLDIIDIEGDRENTVKDYRISDRVNTILGQWVMEARPIQ